MSTSTNEAGRPAKRARLEWSGITDTAQLSAAGPAFLADTRARQAALVHLRSEFMVVASQSQHIQARTPDAHVRQQLLQLCLMHSYIHALYYNTYLPYQDLLEVCDQSKADTLIGQLMPTFYTDTVLVTMRNTVSASLLRLLASCKAANPMDEWRWLALQSLRVFPFDIAATTKSKLVLRSTLPWSTMAAYVREHILPPSGSADATLLKMYQALEAFLPPPPPSSNLGVAGSAAPVPLQLQQPPPIIVKAPNIPSIPKSLKRRAAPTPDGGEINLDDIQQS